VGCLDLRWRVLEMRCEKSKYFAFEREREREREQEIKTGRFQNRSHSKQALTQNRSLADEIFSTLVRGSFQ
jgi:hypothetical protein